MKERLIGAAVLVALGVWLIPWVLDGPAQLNESRSAELQLPVPEEPVAMRSQTIHLDQAHGPPGTAAVSAAPDSLDVAHETGGASPTPVPVASSTVSAEQHEEVPAREPVSAPRSTIPESSHATDGRTSAPSAVHAGWMVQLGSFSEEENARRLAQRVGTFGYTPEISNHRASGRTMYRVRVGPHESRARADAAASGVVGSWLRRASRGRGLTI